MTWNFLSSRCTVDVNTRQGFSFLFHNLDAIIKKVNSMNICQFFLNWKSLNSIVIGAIIVGVAQNPRYFRKTTNTPTLSKHSQVVTTLMFVLESAFNRAIFLDTADGLCKWLSCEGLEPKVDAAKDDCCLYIFSPIIRNSKLIRNMSTVRSVATKWLTH